VHAAQPGLQRLPRRRADRKYKRRSRVRPTRRAAGTTARHRRDLVETGALRPVIDRTYPFSEIVEATRYVETEQKTGSVVLLIAGATAG
jgi:NADPH:quinone reductase-like Zn-dependent oxidoreductase